MIRRPPRSTLDRSSAASDVYKRQALNLELARNMDETRDQKKMDEQISLNPDFYDLSRFKGDDNFRSTVVWKDVQTKLLFQKYQSKYGVTTVSYTHLRAHETVLDLVCRLLLEKKNQNN